MKVRSSREPSGGCATETFTMVRFEKSKTVRRIRHCDASCGVFYLSACTVCRARWPVEVRNQVLANMAGNPVYRQLTRDQILELLRGAA